MFQTFYSDTLGSRFIKSLLAQTPIPIFEAVVDGDHLLAECYYVYKQFIIKCNSSGILQMYTDEVLVPSDTLYPSEFLFPETGFKVATFYVISRVEQEDVRTHETFLSSSNSYDSKTHYYLGRYLRYLYTTTGLNLFPYYNCFNSTYFSDVLLSTSSDVTSDIKEAVVLNKRSTAQFKIAAVPICFGKTYTIHVDCSSTVLLRACIHDDSGVVSEEELPETTQIILKSSGQSYGRLSFKNPVQFRIETSSKEAFMLQKNLYLLIQLPLENNSSIVVFENFDSRKNIQCDENGVRKYSIINPSLSSMNTNVTYAFSDRLLEYLVGNVIHSRETISQNIELVQRWITRFNADYKRALLKRNYAYGIWDKSINKHLFNIVEQYSDDNLIYDQDGNFNKEVQNILLTKGGWIV